MYRLGFDLAGDRIRLEGGVKILRVICNIMLVNWGSIATHNSVVNLFEMPPLWLKLNGSDSMRPSLMMIFYVP